MKRLASAVVAAVLLAGPAAQGAEDPMGKWQGDWKGTLTLAGGAKQVVAAQLIALGDGKARMNVLEKFDTRAPALAVLNGAVVNGRLALSGTAKTGKLSGTEWAAVLAGDAMTGSVKGKASGAFQMKRVVRLSSTLGAKPPEGAIVLFDGTSLNAFVHRGNRPCRWKLLVDEKAMEIVPRAGGIVTTHKFADHKLHIEFRTPFEPKKRGQGRGNSGVYLQGRYEVQVLDSYGLEGRSNECGGIYGVGQPRVNMCAPPLQWQTYDITFYAPRFGKDGKRIKNARMTVLHNGVEIHRDVDVPRPTTACWDTDVKASGGLHLQDHGNRVQYRNIWAVELRNGKGK